MLSLRITEPGKQYSPEMRKEARSLVLIFEKNCSQLPINLVVPLSYSLVIYFLAGLRTDAYSEIISSIINILLYNVTAALGVLYSVIFESIMIAQSYGNPTLNVIMFCCGLFIKLSSLPFIISWVKYISWFTYACSATYIVQLRDVYDIQCDTNVNVPCLHTGREVLKSFDFDHHSLVYNLSMMVVLYFVFHILAYILLLFKIKRRRV